MTDLVRIQLIQKLAAHTCCGDRDDRKSALEALGGMAQGDLIPALNFCTLVRNRWQSRTRANYVSMMTWREVARYYLFVNALREDLYGQSRRRPARRQKTPAKPSALEASITVRPRLVRRHHG